MNKTTKSLQIIPLLISVTVAVILIAVTGTREPLEIGYIAFGALCGAFFLDLDYILYAFWVEPKKDFSKNLTTYIKHKDFKNALSYVQTHKNEIKDKTLNSALFQLVFALFSIFIVSSPNNILVKTLAISVMANSLYRMAECYFENNIEDWFWSFKDKPNQKTLIGYTLGLLLVLTYCIYSF